MGASQRPCKVDRGWLKVVSYSVVAVSPIHKVKQYRPIYAGARYPSHGTPKAGAVSEKTRTSIRGGLTHRYWR